MQKLTEDGKKYIRKWLKAHHKRYYSLNFEWLYTRAEERYNEGTDYLELSRFETNSGNAETLPLFKSDFDSPIK